MPKYFSALSLFTPALRSPNNPCSGANNATSLKDFSFVKRFTANSPLEVTEVLFVMKPIFFPFNCSYLFAMRLSRPVRTWLGEVENKTEQKRAIQTCLRNIKKVLFTKILH